MARILAVDWDNAEVRFVLGNTTKNALVVLKAGAIPLETVPLVSSDQENNLEENLDSITDDENETGASLDISSEENSSESLKEDVPLPSSESSENTPLAEEKVLDPVAEKIRRIGGALRTLLKRHKVGAAPLYLALARGEVETILLQVPRMSDTELPDIVKNQVLRESTTYIEGQPLDYLRMAGETSSTLEVMSVSTTRVQLKNIRSILGVASRKPAKLEFRAVAVAEMFLGRPFPIFGEDEEVSSRQVLLITQVCDEIHLTVCDGKAINGLRTFKLPGEIPTQQRQERLVSEIVRTIAITTKGPDASPVNRAIHFDILPSTESIDPLSEALREKGIALETVNPFHCSGIELKINPPEHPGRYAPLLGMLWVEQTKRNPLIDLLHPRQKPKPPNYLLFFAIFLLITACLVGYAWLWNKGELKRLQGEVAGLEQQRTQLVTMISNENPLYQILNTANRWDNSFGVIVLDELRDITLRIPKAPDLIVTRLAYSGNYRGQPVFIMSGKVTSPMIYQQFYYGLTFDKSHTIASAGPKPLTDGGGFSHEFSAQIFCMRQSWNMYFQKLPPNLQQISNTNPEEMK